MTLEELSVKYNRFYEEADTLLKHYDPCQFIGSRCVSNRDNPNSSDKDNGCCNGCDWLGSAGCIAECLRCKLHICRFTEKDNTELEGKLGKLIVKVSRAFKDHAWDAHRTSKENIIETCKEDLERGWYE